VKNIISPKIDEMKSLPSHGFIHIICAGLLTDRPGRFNTASLGSPLILSFFNACVPRSSSDPIRRF
jgi:hypothetical protein